MKMNFDHICNIFMKEIDNFFTFKKKIKQKVDL